jgi:hypothetical protein
VVMTAEDLAGDSKQPNLFWGMTWLGVMTWQGVMNNPYLILGVMTWQGVMRNIRVPRSIPSLVTRRLLVMTFLPGDPITRLKDDGRVAAMPAAQRR